MAWAIDRLGRSLIDLLRTIQDLEAVGVDLYLDQQHLDTTTPTGKLLFQVTGAFAEFERSMIRQWVKAGLGAIKARIKRDGHFTTKAGIVRRRLGRPGADPAQIARAQVELAKGLGIGKVARLTGLGTGTVHKLKREMAVAPTGAVTGWIQLGPRGFGATKGATFHLRSCVPSGRQHSTQKQERCRRPLPTPRLREAIGPVTLSEIS